METMIGFAAVGMVTLFSLFAALALQGLLMKLAFQLMQPATADRRVVVVKAPIARGPRGKRVSFREMASRAGGHLGGSSAGNWRERKRPCLL